MIFPEHKLIFLHSGKTAGSAIEKMLLPEVIGMPYDQFNEKYFYGSNGQVLTQHASAVYTRSCLPKEVWRNYKRFTVVRNPYDRLWSVFNYTHDQHEKRFGTFENFILSLHDELRNLSIWKGSHYLPQWAYASINDSIVVQHIIRFENLKNDVAAFRHRFKIENSLEIYNTYTNPKRNKDEHVAKHYTPEMRRVMNDIYEKDFMNFDYEVWV